MADSLSQEIETRLTRYLRDEDALAEFEAWLVPEAWDISPQSDRVAHDLATGITLRIAEFSNGDCAEEDLKEALRELVGGGTLEITLSGVAKDQEVMSSLGLGSFSVVGRPHSEAFA